MTRSHALAIMLVVAAVLPGVAEAQFLPASDFRPGLPGLIGFFDDTSDPDASNQVTLVAARDDTDADAQLIAANGTYTVTLGTQVGTVLWALLSPDKYTLNSGPGRVQYQFSQAAFALVRVQLSGPVTFTMTELSVEGCSGSASMQRLSASERGKWNVSCNQSALTAMGLTSPAVKAALRQLFGSDRRIQLSGAAAPTTP